MKPKTMILMVLAVACGLGASYMTSRLLAERVTEEQEKIVILVAKKNLDTGVTIKDPKEMFAEKAVAKDEEPKNAVDKFDDLKGRVLKHALREGDFVSAGDLLSDKESWIAYILPKGYRAIGLKVNMESQVAGFASLPLSRVDIISTVRKGEKDSYAKVLLQNVLVLAADQETVRNESKVMPAAVVTLALTPVQALKVALAKEFGPLTLALRKFNDNQKSINAKVTLEGMQTRSDGDSGDDDDLPPPPKVQPVVIKAPEPKAPAVKTHTHTLTLENDGRQEQWEFTLNEENEVVSHRMLARTEVTPSRPSLNNPPPPMETPVQPAPPVTQAAPKG